MQKTNQRELRDEKVIKRISCMYVKVEFNLSNYAIKSDTIKTTGVDTSECARKTDLASLKLEVNELDIDKLKTVPVDLSKLSNVGDNDVVKKIDYNNLVIKVNAIDTSGFILKAQYSTDKAGC